MIHVHDQCEHKFECEHEKLGISVKILIELDRQGFDKFFDCSFSYTYGGTVFDFNGCPIP